MLKKLFITLLTLAISVSSIAASSPRSPYQINVIIFKNADNSGLNSEIWPANPQQPKIANAVNLLPASDTTAGQNLAQIVHNNANSHKINNPLLRVLPDNQFGLKNTLGKMQKSNHYKVITFVSWRQLLTNGGKSQLIHIYGGQAYDAQSNVIDNPANLPPQTLQPAINLTPNSNKSQNTTDNTTQPIKAAKWELNGTLKVSKSGFIIFSSNLLLTEPVPVVNTDDAHNNTPETKLMSFPLTQTIRTRGNEIHYLDNPLYGVLVLITKVKH